jgi:hypothetical protein
MTGRAPAGDRHRRPPGSPTTSGADRSGDRGSVTVEAALALCSLAVFLAVAIGAIAAVTASVRCTDAARELARLAARGEPDRGREIAAAIAPTGAEVVLTAGGDLGSGATVVAEVSARPVAVLPLRVGGRAVAAVEPGVVGG